MRFYRSVACAAAFSLFTPYAALAQTTPSDVRDLVGVRASSGESALQSRGFTHIKTDAGDDRLWANWWNSSRRECITVAVVEGRYDAITASPPADCNQSATSSSSNNAAAIALGAAAILGIAALAHNADKHDDKRHYDDQQKEAAYERGYRDGLYNQSYHNYDRSDAYSDGYVAGVDQRRQETRYRDGHGDGAGYRPSVTVSDLNGARASSADGAMRQRGFNNVGGMKSGTTAYTIWYNPQTRQCLQMGVADGRVQNLVDIRTAPGCG